MTGFLSSFSLSAVDWMLIVFCAMLIGMSKTGVPGVSMIVVPTLALIFGGKQSTGILLPILIMADVFAVVYYHRDAKWKHLLRALPWAVIGLLVALWIGNAWFFFIINLSKFPLQLLVWKNINMHTLAVDILVFPAIAFGAWLGILS